jgi:hypothetical protein
MSGKGGRATRAKGRSSSRIAISDPCFQMGFEGQFVRFEERLTEEDEMVVSLGFPFQGHFSKGLCERRFVSCHPDLEFSKFL